MNSKFKLIPFFIIVGFIGVILAVDIGQANYSQLGLYAALGISLYFFINGWRNIWWFAALLIFSGVIFHHGFEVNADHLFIMMISLASMMSITSRGSIPQVIEFRQAGSRSTAIVVGVLVLYGLLHFFAYYSIPYSAPDYALKTSSKAYFECYASMICFLWLMIGPYGFDLKPTWPRTLLIIICFMLAINVALRGQMFLSGFQAADGLSTGGAEDYFLHVPIINMQAGIFTLRNICPLSTAIILTLASSPGWWRAAGIRLKSAVLLSIFLCLVGALFSGGRATLLFCIIIAFAIAVMRRRMIMIAVMGGFGIICIALINVLSYKINTKAPYYIARAMQVVMIDKGATYDSVGNSQEARNAAIEEALVQWKKDNRVFFFGRSVYKITWAEAEFMKNRFGIDGFVENAMRGGRTHNLATDLLLQYGLVGCVLYLIAYIKIIRFIFLLHRAIPTSEIAPKAMAGAMVVYLPMMFFYQLLGGTFMPIIVALVVGLIRAHLINLRLPLAGTASTSVSVRYQRLPHPNPAFANR
jgi:hypothetical protein